MKLAAAPETWQYAVQDSHMDSSVDQRASPDLPKYPIPSKLACTLSGHNASVLVVRLNDAGTYCLTGSKDRSIRLWNPHKGALIKTYQGHGYDVRGLAISKDNSRFVSCGGDKSIFLWDVASGNIVRRFKGHDAAANDIKYAASEQVVVTASYDQSIRFWDMRSRSFDAIQVVKAFRDSVTSLAITETPYVFASSVDGTVRRLDLRIGSIVCDDVHVPVTCVRAAADGTFAIAACTDGTVRLLDKASGQVLAKYKGHAHKSFQLECEMMFGDAVILAGSEDGTLQITHLAQTGHCNREKKTSLLSLVTKEAAGMDGGLLLSA